MSRPVLDASALIALILEEPGAEAVARTLDQAAVSAVNLSEVTGKLIDSGMAPREAEELLRLLGLETVPFDADLSFAAARLKAKTKAVGLSLGDRACLATAVALDGVAFTADRAWSKLDVAVRIKVIR